MPILPDALRRAAWEAFKDNSKLSLMSLADRETAAKAYEQVASGELGGAYVSLARLYNLERARFLRGEVSRIAGWARDFADEIGYDLSRDSG